MTQFIAPVTTFILLTLLSFPAMAETYLGHQPLATHWWDQSTKAPRATKAKKQRAVKHQPRATRASGLVSIQCGRKTIRVAATSAAQFSGFCRDFHAAYKFSTNVGGYRAGKCWVGGKHPCGGAIDIEQTCRSSKPGHCLPRAFPVAVSEQLAKKWGLTAGSQWRHRDVGHFETAGSLAGNGKWNPGVDVASADPEPKRWPIARIEPEPRIKTVPDQGTPVHEIEAPANKSHRLASIDPGQMLDDSDKPEPQEAVAIWAPVFYFNSPGVWKPTALPVNLPAQSGSVRADIEQAAMAFSVDPVMMKAFARIESYFNCKAHRPGSKYRGAFQLSPYEMNKYLPGGDVFNCRDNAIAAARKFATEAEQFEQDVGRKATAPELYMIHQQGYQGASFHYSAPHQLAWKNMYLTAEGQEKEKRKRGSGLAWAKKAIIGNVPKDLREIWLAGKQTSGEFIDLWTERVNRFMARKVEPPSHYATAAKRIKVAAKQRYAKRKIRLAQR